MKTNKELNQAFDKAQAERVRPQGKTYDFAPLQAVVNQWVKANEQTWSVWKALDSIRSWE